MKNLNSLKESLKSKIANSKKLTKQELKQINGGGNIGDWYATLEECYANCWGSDPTSFPDGTTFPGEATTCVNVGNGYECDHDS